MQMKEKLKLNHLSVSHNLTVSIFLRLNIYFKKPSKREQFVCVVYFYCSWQAKSDNSNVEAIVNSNLNHVF